MRIPPLLLAPLPGHTPRLHGLPRRLLRMMPTAQGLEVGHGIIITPIHGTPDMVDLHGATPAHAATPIIIDRPRHAPVTITLQHGTARARPTRIETLPAMRRRPGHGEPPPQGRQRKQEKGKGTPARADFFDTTQNNQIAETKPPRHPRATAWNRTTPPGQRTPGTGLNQWQTPPDDGQTANRGSSSSGMTPQHPPTPRITGSAFHPRVRPDWTPATPALSGADGLTTPTQGGGQTGTPGKAGEEKRGGNELGNEETVAAWNGGHT